MLRNLGRSRHFAKFVQGRQASGCLLKQSLLLQNASDQASNLQTPSSALRLSEFTRGFADNVSAHNAPLDHEHVHIGNEIEKELMKASEGGGPDAIFKVIEDHGEDFDEHNVATAFQELAKQKSDPEDIHAHETFLKLVDMAILGRRRFNARLLTSIVKSAATLKFDDEALTDKISENLIQRIDKLDAIEVTDLATGLADLENSPSVVFFEALQKQANKLDQELSEDQKTAIKAAFDKLGYSDYGKKV